MKKYLTLLCMALLVVVMTACTSDEKENTEDNKPNDHEFAEEIPESEAEESQVPVGETAHTEGGSFTYHARNNRLKPIETATYTVDFDKVSAISGELAGGFKEYLGEDEIEYIQLDIEVTNKSDANINFDAYSAKIVTSTGETIETPNPMLSSQIEGKFAPEEMKQGSIFFLLEKSKAEEVEWVQIIMKAPLDENNKEIGEELNIKVKL
ncbi:Telomeric repeat-binding factor 2 [Bacillus sp. THAF10]|uniref:hypothetical protein n=1 Tax=Bacillus sp. THAF10 TaxID=2587848 RepID=UPI0012695EB0|nr:hypothetical protein [Bacillus sp. THAF10]QFT87799.1 Telomeric repeat-binding factor 2 [Bacillus sp. THAF10]